MTSSSSSSSSSSGGIGFAGLLTIVLVILKALGYISISWFLCFLPIIIVWGIVFGILAIGILIAIFAK